MRNFGGIQLVPAHWTLIYVILHMSYNTCHITPVSGDWGSWGIKGHILHVILHMSYYASHITHLIIHLSQEIEGPEGVRGRRGRKWSLVRQATSLQVQATSVIIDPPSNPTHLLLYICLLPGFLLFSSCFAPCRGSSGPFQGDSCREELTGAWTP